MFSGVKVNKARREHEDREAVLPGALKGHVYRPQGWLSPVVLVDGRMEGVWRHERRGGGRTAGPLRRRRARALWSNR